MTLPAKAIAESLVKNKKTLINHFLNYLYSKIDNFNSSVFATKLDFFYNTDEMIIEIFIDNYGKVLNSYTRYIEDLPKLYGYSLLFKPKNLNVLLSLKQEYQNNVSNFNFNTSGMYI